MNPLGALDCIGETVRDRTALCVGSDVASPDAPPFGLPEVAEMKDAISEFAAAFVFDVTIPDDTLIVAGTPFIKTWRIENIGSKAWDNCTLVLVPPPAAKAGSSEEPVSVVNDANLIPESTTVPIPECCVGSWVDVSVNFTSPVDVEEGPARSKWFLLKPNGTRFDRGYLRYLYMDCVLAVPAQA